MRPFALDQITLSLVALTFGAAVSAFAAPELRLTSADTVIYLANDSDRLELPGVENSSLFCSGGMCAGITSIQYAILSSVTFQSGPADPPELIRDKLVAAAKAGDEVTIFGFRSTHEFVGQMKATYPGSSPRNPIIQAMEIAQRSQGIERLPGGRARVTWHDRPVSELRPSRWDWGGKLPEAVDQGHAISKRIESSQPVRLTMAPAQRAGIAHAVTVVGMVRTAGEAEVSRYLISDPNFPGTTSVLELKDGRWIYGNEQMGVLMSESSEREAARLASRLKTKEISGPEFKGIPGLQKHFRKDILIGSCGQSFVR